MAAGGIDVAVAKDGWYREIGQGMGPALNMASSSNAYLLSDRGTWLSFKNRGDLAILTEGDKRLFNQYGVMLVNPAKQPNVKAQDGQAFSTVGLVGVLFAGQSPSPHFGLYAMAALGGAVVGTAIGLRWLTQAATRAGTPTAPPNAATPAAWPPTNGMAANVAGSAIFIDHRKSDFR